MFSCVVLCYFFDCKKYDLKGFIFHLPFIIYTFYKKGRRKRENKQEAQILKNRNKGEGIVKTTNIAYTSCIDRYLHVQVE